MDKKIKNFLDEKITGPYSVKLISDTNNFVWLVESGDSRFVLKKNTINPRILALSNVFLKNLK
jgi:hypothetical protein